MKHAESAPRARCTHKKGEVNSEPLFWFYFKNSAPRRSGRAAPPRAVAEALQEVGQREMAAAQRRRLRLAQRAQLRRVDELQAAGAVAQQLVARQQLRPALRCAQQHLLRPARGGEGRGAIAERGEMRAPHAAHVLNAALAHTRLLHTPKARSSKCREMGSQGRAGEERFCWRTCASAHPPSARTPRAAALREAVGRRAPRSCPASPRPRRRPARRSAGSARCCRAAQAGSRRPARRAARSGRAARC